jgi:thiol:disulfide interchange protein DsbD
MALSYAVLGLLAASTGVLFGSWLQSPLVLIWIAVAITALALSMFGLYELRLPQAITGRLGTASTGLGGACLMGLMVGVVAAPCIGPFLVGLLLLVSQLRNPWHGFLLFFVLGIGMGLPSMVLAVAANRIGNLPKAGAWLIWSKKALGVILLGLALYFLKPLLPARVMQVAVAALLLGAGLYLGWLERSRSPGAVFRAIRWVLGSSLIVGYTAFAWRSVSLVRPRPSPVAQLVWVQYSQTALEQAAREQRPVIIDVYADWCLPCVELDHVTFRHPEVVEALKDVATLRIDATGEVSAEAEALFDRYNVYGVPTVLLFDRGGQERKDLRLLGFLGPKEFLERLKQIL